LFSNYSTPKITKPHLVAFFGKSLEVVEYARGVQVCRYDLADACLSSVEMPRAGFDIYHVVGAKRASERFDIERTEKELGLKFSARFELYE
jgi:hypothetical protein